MKKLLKLAAVCMIAIAAFQSCDGDDGPYYKIEKEYRPYNSKDSAAFCEIMKCAFGPYLDDFMVKHNMRLDSIGSWPHDFVYWIWYDNIKEYRIYSLSLKGENGLRKLNDGSSSTHYERSGVVSPKIWELDSLGFLQISTNWFYGAVPPCGDVGKKLCSITIHHTNITSIPKEMLTLPRLIHLSVCYNLGLTKMPDGYETLPPDEKYNPTIYHFIGNGLDGVCPSDLSRAYWFDNNNFSEINWEEWEKIDFDAKIRYSERKTSPGPILYNNVITGEVPESILKDTLALIYTSRTIGWQRDGCKLTGMPSLEEISKIRLEFVRNHPEYKPYLFP